VPRAVHASRNIRARRYVDDTRAACRAEARGRRAAILRPRDARHVTTPDKPSVIAAARRLKRARGT